MGLALEFEDIEVEGVLPKGFSEGMNKEEFLQVLPELDAEFNWLNCKRKMSCRD